MRPTHGSQVQVSGYAGSTLASPKREQVTWLGGTSKDGPSTAPWADRVQCCLGGVSGCHSTEDDFALRVSVWTGSS